MLPQKLETVAVRVDGLDNSRLDAICTTYKIKPLEFYTMDMELLGFIAKHRILPKPTILIFNKTKPVVRIVGDNMLTLPKFERLLEILSKIYV